MWKNKKMQQIIVKDLRGKCFISTLDQGEDKDYISKNFITIKHRKTASRVKPCNTPEEPRGETGRSGERRNNNIINTQPGARKGSVINTK